MEGVWDDEYEEDDILDYYGEAEEVNEPERKKTKLLDDDPNATKEPKKPRIVQNPRPKLDVDRLLLEDKGLPELLRMVAKLEFTPGKEIDDMKRAMAVFELWAHRLFPKFTFADFITKCETLGKKRPIQTYLRKTRLDML